jgi:hypothetical protein
MKEVKKNVKERIEKYGKDDIIIYAHADHDGICASVGLNYLFGNMEVKFSQSFKPKELPYFKNKKLFIICDLQLSERQIKILLDNRLEVINFDHHEIRDLQHHNYICLNPKKIYGKQFISSSGLMWKIFKPEKIAWILAVGSAGDLAVEDNIDLFEFVKEKFPKLLQATNLEAIYSSKIFELAQIVLMSFDNPPFGFNLVKESINKGWTFLYRSHLYDLYQSKLRALESFIENNKDKIFEHKKFVIINSSNHEYSGSYSVYLNLKRKDKKTYIEYDNGRLFFRNYFGQDDIIALAKLFNGGGAHKRAGGAYTRKSFSEVINAIRNYYEKRQLTLFDF